MKNKLTVWITTYNHEKYIADSIESVLKQKTDFNFNILIGEDCSTDNTRAIVKAYQEKFPDKIVLYLPEKNLGMMPMNTQTYELCSSRYIAWLDGDDYWTDPFKLQKQVDFLENNPDYSFCFHRVSELDQESGKIHEVSHPTCANEDGIFESDDFLREHNPSYALSVVSRNILGNHLPEWYKKLCWGDIGLYCLLLKYGKAKYLKDNMGCYRIHHGGAYAGETNYANSQKAITVFKLLKKNLDYLNKDIINKTIAAYYFRLFTVDYQDQHLIAALHHLSLMAFYDMSFVQNNSRSLIGSIVRLGLKIPGKYYHKLNTSS